MALKNQTKLLFAKKFEEMLQTTPLDKLRVVDLCKECNTIPQTFYYHFHDKYELVAWIFINDFSLTYLKMGSKYSIESIIENLQQMEEHKLFYQKTYLGNYQNSINQYIQDFNIKTALAAIKANTPEKEVSTEQVLAIKYHSYGMMGLFKEWLQDSKQVTIPQLAKFQYSHTPKFLTTAYQNYDFKCLK
ncbi:TetR/AcrR family transcriptional regulator C-terminal domain-containing protein [Companilactobacillus halodurans]|uniref:TetR family transcriptional regulator n=1 Tax=Companilactobacillus halodurans TaxID=2584183 RepID=A0A5P0ZZR5_9LACO|nr:TetR/AcrR family transcriptional regulator C-terminal domain-containing protein [Companilactobacillus halodurans]MQS76783.1 TetR family transcriptional regulator [Companilactobacillus halodurans]MQS98510.1 TetR family transcriptional regulator [Companilactobacillus halodurans]